MVNMFYFLVTGDKRHVTFPLNADEIVLISVLVGGIVISVILLTIYSKKKRNSNKTSFKET